MTRSTPSAVLGCGLGIALVSSFAATTLGSDPLPATFAPAGQLGDARSGHAAVDLPDGRVLVIGGKESGSSVLASAELWDPATSSFELTGPMAEARTRHTATPLADGRVLVVAGADEDDDPLASTEVWDPASGSFEPAGTLLTARSRHTATLLPDGRVIVIGGEDIFGPIDAAELWDPATGTFERAGDLKRARSNHSATLLPDGRVLVAGGDGDEDDVASAEAWDPASHTFGPAGSLSTARSDHTATLLPDGRVLVVGGLDDGFSDPTGSAEVWDAASATFGEVGPLAEARYWHTATPLPDGGVLIVGGLGQDEVRLASAEWFDPSDGTFGPVGSMAEARGLHTASLLPDGGILVIGGLGEGGRLESAERWQAPSVDALPDASSSPAETPPASPSPTLRLSRRAMERELAASMAFTTWKPYRDSPAGVAFDPFESGAQAAVIFDDLEAELHPSIDYLVLFRFPDATALGRYWEVRARAAEPDAPTLAAPCRDGRPGRGSWDHGEYLCYLSSSGTAILRWTDERDGVYGVLNASAGSRNLRTLFRAWQSAIRGPGSDTTPSGDGDSATVRFTAAEKLLLEGIPGPIATTCVALRRQNLRGTVAAFRCRPADGEIREVTYHLMELGRAERLFIRRLRGLEDGRPNLGLRCDRGVPSWEPSVPYGSEACYLDDEGRAALAIVDGASLGCTELEVAGTRLRKPAVHIAVLGADGDIAGLFEAAGRGGRLWLGIEQAGAAPSDMCPHD